MTVSETSAAPLRVLYSFPHAIGAPGIGTTALQQVVALRRAGAVVVVVCASVAPGVALDDTITTLVIAGRRIPHRAFGRIDDALAFHDRRVARMLRGGGFDVVHTWPSGALRTLLAAQSTGVLGTRESPNTHTAHAYAVARDEALRVGSPSIRGQSHHPNPRRLAREEAEFRAARLILVPSERVSETFVEAGVDEEKLARHRYGFDPAVFHPIGRTDDGSRPFTAVFAGSAEPRKGLHYALEAWKRSGIGSDGRFRILGRFAPGYRERLASLLEQPGVEVAGFSDDLAGEFRAADVLVLPSVEEGSALVGYEAQACGCVPLLSRSAGGQFRPGLDGFLHEDRDAETLAEQLRLLHGDPGTLRRMRESCLDGAAALTWDAAGVRMLEIFSAALGR